jgi:hypothetical protein
MLAFGYSRSLRMRAFWHPTGSRLRLRFYNDRILWEGKEHQCESLLKFRGGNDHEERTLKSFYYI